MKSWLWLTSAALIGIFLIACGNKKQNSDQFATSPTDTTCLYGYGSCDNTYYNQYAQYGFSAYPGSQTINMNPQSANRYDVYNNYNSNNQGQNGNITTFCSCPVGTRPVYNGSIGLGCVNTVYMAPYQTKAYYWGSKSSNYDWVNWDQYSNINSASGPNGCYNNLAWACFIDLANSCFDGQTCQTLVNNSRLGICVKK